MIIRATMLSLIMLITGCGGESIISDQSQDEFEPAATDTGSTQPEETDTDSTQSEGTNNGEESPPVGTDGSEQPAANDLVSSAATQVKELTLRQNLDAPASHTKLESAANELDELASYSYPEDFPLAQSTSLLHAAFRVTGLSQRTAYRFSTSGTTEQSLQALFVFNVTEDNSVVSPVCMDTAVCNGTVSGSSALIILVSANSNANNHTFTIEPTGDRAVYNEGTEIVPVLLNEPLPLQHNGAVGPIQSDGDQLIAGQSYYQLTGLTPGSRYRIEMTDRSAGRAKVNFTTPTDLLCDPNFSDTLSCQFVALNTEVEFTATGDTAIFGDAFTLAIDQMAPAEFFDGTWNNPLPLTARTDRTVRHLGIVDHAAGSYYLIYDLAPGISYRVIASGKTNGAMLATFDPQSGEAIYSPQCKAIKDEQRTGADEACVIHGGAPATLWVKGSAMNTPPSEHGSASASQLLLSIVPGVSDEGSYSTPFKLVADATASQTFTIGVRERSIYELENLTTGTAMMVSVVGANAFTRVELLDTNGDSLPCDISNYQSCVFTPQQPTAIIAVSIDADEIGQRMQLTVTPLPDNETKTLSIDDLPHAGQVGSFFSTYLITGLQPDDYYLTEVNQASIRSTAFAWPASSNTGNCNVNSGYGQSAGCLVADSNGEIQIRIGTQNTQPGALFNIDAIPAMPVPADHVSTSPPLSILDNDTSGTTTSIFVENEPADSIETISITVLLDHGYSKDLILTLIAPDGRQVILADHISGSSNIHTVFSDLAAFDSETTEARLYRRSVRPAQPLHPLNDLNPNGQWQLKVADDRYSNISTALGGVFLGWGISFNPPEQSGYPE